MFFFSESIEKSCPQLVLNNSSTRRILNHLRKASLRRDKRGRSVCCYLFTRLPVAAGLRALMSYIDVHGNEDAAFKCVDFNVALGGSKFDLKQRMDSGKTKQQKNFLSLNLSPAAGVSSLIGQSEDKHTEQWGESAAGARATGWRRWPVKAAVDWQTAGRGCRDELDQC